MTRRIPAPLLVGLLSIGLTACDRPLPPAQLTSTVTDSAGVPLIILDRPLADVALSKAGGANDTATLLFVVDSMTHPVAVALLPDGGAAVLDRSEKYIAVFDSTGAPRTRLGGPGDGPGEFRLPAGVVSLGEDIVVLQSWPDRTLTRLTPGERAETVAPPIPGDWSGWFWHRPDISLEFIGQSAPEIWSRRLRGLDDSTFLVYVGPVDEDTSVTARSFVLRFGRDLVLRDTRLTFQAPQRQRRPNPDERGLPQLFHPVWGERPVWSAGEGVVVTGRSHSATVAVRTGTGAVQTIVRWPAANIPVSEEDKRALGDNIARVTLAAAPSAAEMKASMSEAEFEEQMTQFLAGFEFTPTHPELVALFVADRCLWLAGFDPADEGDGTAHEWLVLDLDHPAASPRVITIGGEYERVVAMGRGKAATIRLEEDGFRRVRVYRVPACAIGQ